MKQNSMNHMILKSKSLSLMIFVSVFFMFSFSAFAYEGQYIPQDKLDVLLEDIEKKFLQIKTMQTLFWQEKNIALFAKPVISKGFCIFKSPSKLRFEFIHPFKSSLIVDKNKIYKYEFYNENWQKIDSGNKEILLGVMNNIIDWMQGRFKDSEVYDISAYKGKKLIIVLLPKNKEFKKFIKSFELEINKDLNGLSQIIINEAQNNFTKIVFHDSHINKQISNLVFEGNQNKPSDILPWWDK